MNKKLICLVLAMVMLCAAPLALANSPQDVPGPSTPKKSSSGSGAITSEPLSVTAIGLTAAALVVQAELLAYGDPIVGYFGDVGIAGFLPAGFDLDSLVMYEFASIALTGVDPYFGDFAQPFVFATPYPDGANIVALLGIESGSGVEWVALKAEVVNGFVVVYFTQAVLIALNGRTGMLAILSEAI